MPETNDCGRGQGGGRVKQCDSGGGGGSEVVISSAYVAGQGSSVGFDEQLMVLVHVISYIKPIALWYKRLNILFSYRC